MIQLSAASEAFYFHLKKNKGKKKKIVIIHSFMNPPPLNVHYLNQQQLQVQRGLEGQQPA